MRGQTFTVAGALDDYLIAGVSQPVQGAVPQDGIVEEAEPFFDGPIAGYNDGNPSSRLALEGV